MKQDLLRLLERTRKIAFPKSIDSHSRSKVNMGNSRKRALLVMKLATTFGLGLFFSAQTSFALNFPKIKFPKIQPPPIKLPNCGGFICNAGQRVIDEATGRADRERAKRAQEEAQQAANELESQNSALAAEKQALQENSAALEKATREFKNIRNSVSSKAGDIESMLSAVKTLIKAANYKNELMKDNVEELMKQSSLLVKTLSDFNYFNKNSRLPWSYEGQDPFLSLKVIVRAVTLADGPPNPNDPKLHWLTSATNLINKTENSIVNQYKESATLLTQAAQTPYFKELDVNDKRLLDLIKESGDMLKAEEEGIDALTKIANELVAEAQK